MIRNQLENTLQNLFFESPFSGDERVVLETPRQPELGDFATPLAFSLAKRLKRSPKQIAEDLATHFNAHESFSDQWLLTPVNGYLNVRIKDSYLGKLFASLSVTPPCFPSVSRKVNLEYVSANPTGPLHIGHGRWAVIGSVLASLLKFVGEEVSQEFYVNDAGNQVSVFRESVVAVRSGKPIPENGYHGQYIHDLSQFEGDPLQRVMTLQKETLSRIGVFFDVWFSEKTLHDSGRVSDTLDRLLDTGEAYKSEGAVWFRSTDYGDEKDRVLVKSDGEFTYFLADIAYHVDKLSRGFSQLINIWGADHHGYVPRVSAAIQSFAKQRVSPLTVIIGQLVSLKRDGQPVRMSKRTGEMITLDEVVDEIGVDATRYFLIHKGQDTPLDFDLSLAKKHSNENPVFYIQYAHARLCAILRKLDALGVSFPEECSWEDRLFDSKERGLLVYGLQIYDEFWLSAKNLNPSKIAHYTYDLAKCFHHFYEGCPIVTAEPSVRTQRRQILLQTQFLFQTCFSILGISAPESM